MNREIPLYTLAGVKDADISTHYISTEDQLGLSLLRYTREPCEDVVVIVHGLTTSTDMYIMPEHTNLVQYLLDNGYSDVWTFDFRMSNRHDYNLRPHRYTMDDCALYDYPPALAKVREQSGDKRIHVICHCLGSVSFMMSLAADQVNVTSVISNSVSLTPRIPQWSYIKANVFPFVLERILSIPYVSPRWSEDPYLSLGKVMNKLVSLFHRECDVPACHMLSLMWGTGWPALYSHDNLHEVTHRRGGDLYGGTSLNYHRHVMKMVKLDNRAVKYDENNPRHRDLPDDYFEAAKSLRTPVLFVTGKTNRVFTDSNILCFNRLDEVNHGLHELHVFPGYGHQDPFMGKNVHVDIFPRFLEFLQKQRSG